MWTATSLSPAISRRQAHIFKSKADAIWTAGEMLAQDCERRLESLRLSPGIVVISSSIDRDQIWTTKEMPDRNHERRLGISSALSGNQAHTIISRAKTTSGTPVRHSDSQAAASRMATGTHADTIECRAESVWSASEILEC
jgi:hypothetical protein